MGPGGEQRQTLSVVVPAFDEERRLPALLAAVGAGRSIADDAGFDLLEVIVVDDGSTDGTAALLASRVDVTTIRFPRNRGKGSAVKAGLLAAAGDAALVTDVDLSTPLADLATLAVALRGGADVVLGSRALPGSTIVVRQHRARESLGKAFNLALRALTGLPFRDTQCGFKLVRLSTVQPVAEALRVDGFAFDAELCVRALGSGLRVVEVPVTWTNHPDTRVGAGSAFRMGVDLLRIAWWSRYARSASR